MKSDLTLRWVDSHADIPEALWAACFPPPLEGRGWYAALEGCGIEDQFSFTYGVVSRGAHAIAITPAFVMDVPIRLVVPPALLPWFDRLGRVFPSLRHQRTLFVGSPCSDEGTVGIAAGEDRLAVLRCVQVAVRTRAGQLRAPMLVWKDFGPAFDADMAEVACENGLFRLVSFPGAVVDLRGPAFADYMATLTTSRRNKFKKKLRVSRESVAVEVQVLHRPDAAALAQIFALFEQTYGKATTQFERLDLRFFELIAAQPDSHFVVLRETDAAEPMGGAVTRGEPAAGPMIAFMLCFAHPGREGSSGHVINKFIGIDYRRPKEWFTYFRLWEAAVEWALSIGAHQIQSGQTGYAPKIEIGHRLIPLTNFCAHANPLVHRVYKMAAKTVNWHTLDDDLATYVKAHPDEEPAPPS
ncbi:hypothetical protein BH11PSE8_BH11PSE8_14290 [soil metagenome]